MSDSILPEQIDAGFVPRTRADVVAIELDGEIVLTRSPSEGSGDHSHLLDATASIVWKSLDGATSIRTLADDVAAVTGAEAHVVLADLIVLFRNLGRAGVLDGVDNGPPHTD